MTSQREEDRLLVSLKTVFTDRDARIVLDNALRDANPRVSVGEHIQSQRLFLVNAVSGNQRDKRLKKMTRRQIEEGNFSDSAKGVAAKRRLSTVGRTKGKRSLQRFRTVDGKRVPIDDPATRAIYEWYDYIMKRDREPRAA